jgi:hypothetical protein
MKTRHKFAQFWSDPGAVGPNRGYLAAASRVPAAFPACRYSSL